MIDMVTLDIITDNEEDALKQAKEKVKRNHYRLGGMYECHKPLSESTLPTEMSMTQLKIQKKLLDLMKGRFGDE